jgi:adenylate cyclase
MAKKEKKEKAVVVKKEAKTPKHMHKVAFPLGAKFSFFVGMLLVAIMIAITWFIYNWAGRALEKEVKERGIAIAKNIANNASDPLIKNDDLPLAYFTKEAVQDPMKPEGVEEGMTEYIMTALKSVFSGAAETADIKNEGIYEAVIVKSDGTIASANDVSRMSGGKYTLPEGIRALKDSEDVLVQDYLKSKRHYFDIAVPVTATINNKKYVLGEVHLTISKGIVTKVVIEAAVKIGLIILASLLLGIVASILLVNFMVRPINYLVKGVRAIGEGNYDVEIKLKTSDELGLLTDIFNDTAKSLKEKELIKGAFSRYVSPDLMNEILKDPSKLSLHGKRVRATMLFTDIRGFTTMSESLEPEAVVAVINEYLTIQTDRVFKWKGVLDKFVGDCVMAVYGVPVPKEDDALRAVKTAMDIRESLEKLNEIRKRAKQIVVQIGMGINTGDVVAGNMGSPQKMDYTVIGDNVNLASRLEANAPGGAIYVSDSTYEETKDKIEYKELEPIKVKGKKEPIKIYEPIKIKE